MMALLVGPGGSDFGSVSADDPDISAVDAVTIEDDNFNATFGILRRISDFVLPETHYALSGDVNIAHQVMGDGPVDLVLVPGLISATDALRN